MCVCLCVCVHFFVLGSVSEAVFVCSSENSSSKKKMDMERCVRNFGEKNSQNWKRSGGSNFKLRFLFFRRGGGRRGEILTSARG